MANRSKRAVVKIDEATGRRIRQLSLAEPYPNSQEIHIAIEFDDETTILIEVGCCPCFGVTHLVRNAQGDLIPVKEAKRGSIRSLVNGRQ